MTTQRSREPALRRLHRLSAVLIALFAAVHLANHLAALRGIDAHIAFMEAARVVYRQPLVEAVLLACVAFQVASGLTLVLRGRRERRGVVAWLQAGAGAYLALFLLIHVSAILFGRIGLDLDTNFWYAAAGFHVPPYPLFFVPYYFLAVVALFAHLACARYWGAQAAGRRPGMATIALPTLAGTAIGIAIVLLFAGAFYPVNVPVEYKATYSRFAWR